MQQHSDLPYPVKVHLMGGEQTGWALDADLATTQAALTELPDLIRLSPLREADVVHSVWEWPLLHEDRRLLAGKRIVCHVCNDVVRTFQQPCMLHAREVIGLWVPISREADRELAALNLNRTMIPYVIDSTVFTPDLAAGLTRQGLRDKWGIPQDAFVISNFMRDSAATNLRAPKEQKGVELFLEILRQLHQRARPVHVLLAGPRRHWIRQQLRRHRIPLTFVGTEVDPDDNAINILAPAEINLLYHVSDLHLVTSRWEGGPRAVLEAAATRTPMLSTPVGMAPDVLEPSCLFSGADEGVRRIEAEIAQGVLRASVGAHYARVVAGHTTAANVPRFREIYQHIGQVPLYAGPAANAAPAPARRSLAERAADEWRRIRRRRRPGHGLSIGLWHEFHKPPYGGGNQFMAALRGALEQCGVRVYENRVSSRIDVHICNSAWFDHTAFARLAQENKLRMIHRVDGPIALYRGSDLSADQKIFDLNQQFASATVCQSGWSMRELYGLGFRPVRPVIIHNAVDPRFFHPGGRNGLRPHRKIRLISTAWSDNPRKGGPFYRWLDAHLDWSRFEYTFVGRIQEHLAHIRHVPPLSSRALGSVLRDHDIYITASQKDPCSNALLEALACGLPALYLDDGGHRELTGFGGLPFSGEGDFMPQLDRLAADYHAYRSSISVPGIEHAARNYIELALGVLAG